MVEILDYFNDNMVKIGESTRAEVHKKGYWHQTFHCWILTKFEDEKYIIFQKRGSYKKVCPNMLDVSVAGHLMTGETKEDGIRELSEELGINVSFNKLKYLGIRCSVADLGDVIEREFAHVHMYMSDKLPEEYKLQIDEVAGIVFMKIEDGLKLFSNTVDKVRVWGYEINLDNERNELDYYVTTKDFINSLDNYYLRTIIMAERYFEGKEHLSI